MNQENQASDKVKIKIPSEVARIIGKWGSHKLRLAAARGAVPMSGPNLVMALFVFCHGENQELKNEALNTLNTLPEKILLAALSTEDLHPAVIDLIVRHHYQNPAIMQSALAHRMIGLKSLMFLAEESSDEVLDMLSHQDDLLRKVDALRQAVINNPHAEKHMKLRLGWVEAVAETVQSEPEPSSASGPEDEGEAQQNAPWLEDYDEEKLSKYQLLQTMPVAEKIRIAMTGDKEWRTLLLRESNKQVNTAVLKNPRITEGEVITVAKNRSSNDELIRLIVQNREWVKLYEVKKALVMHPRTPLQMAMRFMTFLGEKDLKDLAKSREVTQVIVNNARRLLMTRQR